MSYNRNEIEFCEWCGCEKFKERTIDSVDNMICESELLCEECGERVNLWEYGYYYNFMSPEYLKQKQNKERKLKIEWIEKNSK